MELTQTVPGALASQAALFDAAERGRRVGDSSSVSQVVIAATGPKISS